MSFLSRSEETPNFRREQRGLGKSTEVAADPRKLPKLSPARQSAVDTAISEGKARSVRHALFLNSAGVLSLPE